MTQDEIQPWDDENGNGSEEPIDFFEGGEQSDQTSEQIIEAIAKQNLGNDEVRLEIEKISKQFPDPNTGMAFVELADGNEIQYVQETNPRCSICHSEHRNQIERAYIEGGQSLAAAKLFLKENGINIPATRLWTHLDKHCDFSSISIRWMDKIQVKQAEIAEIDNQKIQFLMAAVLTTIEDMDARLAQCGADKDAAGFGNALFKGYALWRDIIRLELESAGLVSQDEVEKFMERALGDFNKILEKIIEKVSPDAQQVIRDEMKNMQIGG